MTAAQRQAGVRERRVKLLTLCDATLASAIESLQSREDEVSRSVVQSLKMVRADLESLR